MSAASRFERASVRLVTELEAKFVALGDDDREALGELLGAAARVLQFLNGVKSPELLAAGGLVKQLFEAALALRAPLIGAGDAAGEIIDAQIPALERAAPTVAAVLRQVLAPEGAA